MIWLILALKYLVLAAPLFIYIKCYSLLSGQVEKIKKLYLWLLILGLHQFSAVKGGN